ncbi:MAG: LptA/OstA family protein [Paracoccaceae bacterium]
MPSVLRLICLCLALALPASSAAAQDGGSAVDLQMTEHDSSLPVEITSDDLSLDQAENSATFTGNVIAVQGALTLTTDRLLVEYARNETSGANEIVRVTATGNVVMVQEHPEEPERRPDVAESQLAVYTVADETMVMTQDVLLVRDGTVLTSDRFTYHLPTGRGVMEGRVTTLLTPARE